MCNNCKTNSRIRVSIKPVTVRFEINISKSGKLIQSSDFEASQDYDFKDYRNNDHVCICENCGKEVDLDTLEIVKSCQICGNTEQYYCKYNEMNFCLSCAKKRLNYCKTCPFISGCELGSLNVNS